MIRIHALGKRSITSDIVFLLAPLESSSWTTSSWRLVTASIRAVDHFFPKNIGLYHFENQRGSQHKLFAASIKAPLSSRDLTTNKWPDMAAKIRAVLPS